jgi:5-dehydro-2-deoxygluconokinase
MPTWPELEAYMARAPELRRPDDDPEIRELHRVTTPRPGWPEVCVLAIDNRIFLAETARNAGVPVERLRELKRLLAEGGRRAAEPGMPALGVILDDEFGFDALCAMTGTDWWVARPVEQAGIVPLAFIGPDVGLMLRTWPREHIIKCLVRYHPDDDELIRDTQLERLVELHAAARATEHELLIELIPRAHAEPDTVARAMAQMYARGIRPDWWKLEAPHDAGTWRLLDHAVRDHDPHCRGILILGGGASEAELADRFRVAATFSICRGFAVGRTIFAAPAEAWLRGDLDDAGVIDAVR